MTAMTKAEQTRRRRFAWAITRTIGDLQCAQAAFMDRDARAATYHLIGATRHLARASKQAIAAEITANKAAAR